MTVVTGKIDANTITLNKKNVLRYAGQRDDKVGKALGDILFEEINKCKNLSNILYTYDVYNKNNCPIPVNGNKLSKILKSAKYWAFFILTAGPLIDKKIDEYFEKGNYTRALILDASANELIEKAADQLENIIRKETNCKKSTTRLSPGYGRWELSVQPYILKYLNGKDIQVTVNKSYFLTPRKTITAVMGLGTSYNKTNKCDDCDLDCEFRKRT